MDNGISIVNDDPQIFFRGCPSVVAESSEVDQLLVALLEAQKSVKPPSKDSKATVKGTAKGSGRDYEYTYMFTAGEDMWAAGRQAFLSADLLWSMCGWEVRMDGALAYLDGYFELVHPASQQFRIYKFPMPITGTNASDKNLAGAQTYLGSKVTRGILMIPQEEENQPDKRAREPEQHYAQRESTRTVTPPNGKPAASPDDASEDLRASIQAWWRRLQKANAAIGGEELKWSSWCCEVFEEKSLPVPENGVVKIPTKKQGVVLLNWLKVNVPLLEEAAKNEPKVVPDSATIGEFPDEEPPEGEGYQEPPR